ncbi:hypothetical protein [Blastococcus montanus]|uniref:hypothetical protein n=1 Tax=Blastococcus montanus TaxID=3144973 RepID=UPI003208ECAA
MSVHAEHRPATAEQPTVQHRPATRQPVKKGPEDRGLLMALGVALVALLVFGAMVALTMLGCGDGYAPWAP